MLARAKKWPTREEFEEKWLDFDITASEFYDWISSHAAPEVPGEVREALEDAVETMQSAQEDMLHCFENKCVPTQEEVNSLYLGLESTRQALKSLEGCREAVGEDEISKQFREYCKDDPDPGEWDAFKAGFKASLEMGSK